MLHERVWAELVYTLAKSWGLSGRGLAKACKRAGVPVPPRGYWARVQNGQRPRWTVLREASHPVEILVNLPREVTEASLSCLPSALGDS